MTFLIVTLASLAVFRMAELVAFDSGPFHIFKSIRDAMKGNPLWRELFTCYYCQSAWWAIVVSSYVWHLGFIRGTMLPIYSAAVAGLAVVVFRILPAR